MNGEVKLNISQSRGFENVSLIKIENKDGLAVVSSRVVAQDFGKRHAHVLDKIEELIKTENSVMTMFVENSYKAGTGKQYKEYLLTRDGFSLLVMGFTGKEALQWKLQYIEAFNKMEELIKQQIQTQIPNSPMDILKVMFSALEEQKQDIVEVKQKIYEFEENAKLEPSEYSLVSKRVSQRVYEVQKERQMNLTQKQIGELFRALNRDILEITGVKTRTQLRQKHLDMVLEFIADWYPSRAVMFNINQMSLAI